MGSQKLKSEKTTEASPNKKRKLNDEENVKGFEKLSKKSSTKLAKTPGKLVKLKKNHSNDSKPPNWNEIKKEKKELHLKRKKAKSGYELIADAKKIAEKLRVKVFKDGEEARKKMVSDLHESLKAGVYPKFVRAHDTARIVQHMLKYGSVKVRSEIASELIPITMEMMQSKYAKFCVKNLLKYGSDETRSKVIDQFCGNAVKLSCHLLSASIFEMGFSTWASTIQKRRLVQEFFGDMYKNTKDDSVKHLRDVYEKSSSMKDATLSATKANLVRVLNKGLLASELVHTVCHQFMEECGSVDKTELISQLAPHVVLLSNTKEGVKVAMTCIWNGTNKDKKVILKALKEHVISLCTHEFGYCTVIIIFSAIDDTVLISKMLLSQICQNGKELASNEHGRKVLSWLVAPNSRSLFHPSFTQELEEARKQSSSKKDADIREKELLGHILDPLTKLIQDEPEFWLSSGAIGLLTVAIVNKASGEELQKCLDSICGLIAKPDWKVESGLGIEDPGLHIALKKLAQGDKARFEAAAATFSATLVNKIDDSVLKSWLTLNRGCFLLVVMYENGNKHVQTLIENRVKIFTDTLSENPTKGGSILLEKIS